MQQLLEQLGIDWKLLLSQVVNFLILLSILTFFVYKPIIEILKKRRDKIETGLQKAAEADSRLKEAQNAFKEKIKEAEGQSMAIIKDTEKKAKNLEIELLEQAREKEKQALKNTDLIIHEKKLESEKIIKQEAVDLIKKALTKTVELSPESIDEALIRKAVAEIAQ